MRSCVESYVSLEALALTVLRTYSIPCTGGERQEMAGQRLSAGLTYKGNHLDILGISRQSRRDWPSCASCEGCSQTQVL